MKEDPIRIEGAVAESLPNATCRVRLPNGHVVLAHVSGKKRANLVRFLPGERVNIEMSPYDLSTGRILSRPDAAVLMP